MNGSIQAPVKQQPLVLLAALAATFIPVILIEMAVLHSTGNQFMYPLDDTFIHMTIAKNLAFNHSWGVNGTEFGSASSSLLYTVTLAALFKLFGTSLLIPFVFNCIMAVVLLVVVQQWLARQYLQAKAQLIILLLVVLFTPLPIMIISGMEHILQCLFSFLFITSLAEWLERNKMDGQGKYKIPWKLIVYGILVTATRYEGLFLIAIACLALLYFKQFGKAIMLGFLCLLPIIIFGLFSLTKGSYFLPNSVLVKSDSIPFSIRGLAAYFNNIFVDKLTLVSKGITQLATQRLLLILPLAFLAFRKQLSADKRYLYMLAVLFGATLLQLSFAATGWFYRYEAYLVMSSTILISILVLKQWRGFQWKQNILQSVAVVIIALILFFPLVLRSAAAFTKAKQACINIYEQQYQMGRFFSTYYHDEPLAANDIGAVSFLKEPKILDLWGLGNTEVAKSKKGNYWTPGFLDSLARTNRVKMAVVYDSWFDPALLQKWKKLATWQIPNNVICGDDIVSFYAIDTAVAGSMQTNLHLFEPTLPKEVKVKYY